MLESMTARQFYRWQEFDAAHPIGDLRSEVEFARLKKMIAGIVGGESKAVTHYMWSFMQEGKGPEVNVGQRILQVLGLKKDGD